MARIYDFALVVHIVAGVVALLVFWLPLVTKKGGRAHRRFGWVYVAAASVVATSGFVVCARLIADENPRRHRAGVFLLYVGLLAAASAIQGVRALRTKRRTEASRAAVDLVPPLLLLAGGVTLAAFGVEHRMPLYVGFAALGALQGAARLRFWLTPPSTGHEWLLAHMTGMGTSCITTVTAFVVVNAQRLGMHTFDLALWAAPIVLGAAGLTFWTRREKRRLTRAGAQIGAQKTSAKS